MRATKEQEATASREHANAGRVGSAQPALEPRAADWRRILDLMAERHSSRDYDGSEIDRELLAAIVRDGTEAPSSCNQQNWHFIIVTDPELKRRAQDIAGGNPHFADCAALVYLCFQKGWTHNNFSIVQSVAGACYHMMLSAHLRGLSCIWNAGIGDTQRIAEMLGVPPTFQIQGALAIGRARASQPPMKAPRRSFAEVHSFNGFARPAKALYPARPAAAYPFERIHNTDNPFAEWNPQVWGWERLADFRGLSVWAKSPLAGVYVSRRQGDATALEIGLLDDLAPGSHLVELLPWGGTYSVELRRRFGPQVHLHLAELSERNHLFIEERLRQEGVALERVHRDLIRGGRLPYADASIDAVIAPQALEHTPDPAAVLGEIRRVLRPGGQLAISVRNSRSRYGWYWRRVESRAQVPNQGPFRPLPASRVSALLRERFRVQAEFGIGRRATHDAAVVNGLGRTFCRLLAARCVRE